MLVEAIQTWGQLSILQLSPHCHKQGIWQLVDLTDFWFFWVPATSPILSHHLHCRYLSDLIVRTKLLGLDKMLLGLWLSDVLATLLIKKNTDILIDPRTIRNWIARRLSLLLTNQIMCSTCSSNTVEFLFVRECVPTLPVMRYLRKSVIRWWQLQDKFKDTDPGRFKQCVPWRQVSWTY